MALTQPMIDPFGRRITYLRVSVTDRCDFRCVYCMAETRTFLPRKDLLTLEEIDRLASAFIAKGVRKLRLTGGEPLVRKNIMWLIDVAVAASRRRPRRADAHHQWQPACALRRDARRMRRRPHQRLARHARCGAKFKAITRWGDLAQVMPASTRPTAPGIKIKINTVALRGVNEDEIEDLFRWAHGRGFDLTLIETMPMGEIGADRTEQYLPLSLVRARLGQHFTLRRHCLPLRRTGALCACARDRRQARLHHAA